MGREPLQPQDKYVLRLPDGMRDRIKKSAERNGRSMNAEIVKALETYFPAEPSVEQVMERVHAAIEMSKRAEGMPYRSVLIDALNALSERLASGIEFDQFRSHLPTAMVDDLPDFVDRMRRWERAAEVGVEQRDLERELDNGLFRHSRGDTVRQAIELFKRGLPERALRSLRLGDVKFAEPEAAYSAIESHLQQIYKENWGDINDPPPWENEHF